MGRRLKHAWQRFTVVTGACKVQVHAKPLGAAIAKACVLTLSITGTVGSCTRQLMMSTSQRFSILVLACPFQNQRGSSVHPACARRRGSAFLMRDGKSLISKSARKECDGRTALA